MTDSTHQEIMEKLSQIEVNMATKDDITRLERKMDGYHKVNINHHLETRSMIGDLNQKYDHLREGLLKAAGAA